jgi:hypothetical protein
VSRPALTPAAIRFAVEPGDVPPEKAARRLHLTLDEFQEKLPALLQRGFPPPDATTGMFDLDAIDAWRRARFPRLFRLTESSDARNSREVARARIERL